MNARTKLVLGILAGAALGFAYYYFVGCRTGACPLTGNPIISTLYGGLIGGLLFLPGIRKKGEENSH
ncbi:hypothetical protein JXO59_02055 [candidate division KSB1 bacterium]|nr:hypothetical protein [candidate division KSB1 bacterium]